MSTRLALVIATTALIAAACGAAAPAPATSSPAPLPVETPSSPVVQPSPSEPAGDVDGVQEGRPELAIEAVGSDVLEITVAEPDAKAWRIAISGTDTEERLELIVETSDIAPGIRVDEIVGGVVIASQDLTRMPGDPTVAAGGCHRTLGVCYASDGIKLEPETGALAATFRFQDPSLPIAIVGSTADWPSEPFILGDWRDSQPFKSWE